MTLEFKRGSTYRLPCQLVDANGVGINIENVTISSHVRQNLADSDVVERCDSEVGQCAVEKTTAATGHYELLIEVSTGWPLGPLYADIRYLGISHATQIDLTETIHFVCVIQATRS